MTHPAVFGDRRAQTHGKDGAVSGRSYTICPVCIPKVLVGQINGKEIGFITGEPQGDKSIIPNIE